MTDREHERDRARRDDAASDSRPESVEAFHGLAAAYALDALDADERARFERALADSPELRDEVDGYAASAAHLAERVEPVPPPSSLRDRLMAEVEATPQAAPDAAAAPDGDAAESDDGGPAAAEARRRWFLRPGAIVAAAAAVVLLIAGVVVGVGWTGPNGWGAQRELQAIEAAPDAVQAKATLPDGGEVTVISSEALGRSAVVATELPGLDDGRVYELWYLDDAGAEPAGLMGSGGDAWRVLEGEFRAGRAVGITVEPSGGSPQPTTDPIVVIAA